MARAIIGAARAPTAEEAEEGVLAVFPDDNDGHDSDNDDDGGGEVHGSGEAREDITSPHVAAAEPIERVVAAEEEPPRRQLVRSIAGCRVVEGLVFGPGGPVPIEAFGGAARRFRKREFEDSYDDTTADPKRRF